MNKIEEICFGLAGAIGALRALRNKFPKTDDTVSPCIQACMDAMQLLKKYSATHDEEQVIQALENCIGQPKCRDCPWEECEYEHEVVNSVPYSLLRDVLAILKLRFDHAGQGPEVLP